MCFRLFACLAFASALLLSSAEKFRYDGHHVISVNIENEYQRDFVERLDASTDAVHVFERAIINREALLIVAPQELADIESMFLKEGLVYQVQTTNLQKLINEEQPENIPRDFGWTAYYPLKDIYAWLDEKIEQYPKLLTNYEIGTTYENRTIRAVRLSHKKGNPIIFIESTIHANEWITVATATYLLNELLTSKNATIVDLARNFDWVIIPVLNVDGYAYTHSHKRMWRKNRQATAIAHCPGVDVNRNFNPHFGNASTSKNPCTENYHGPSPLSERESSAVARFIDKFGNTKLYISFHAFGQLLMYPYGYTRKHATNHDHLKRIGQKSADAISRRYGTSYRVGSIYSTIYPASGISIDWVFENKNITLAYSFEFRPQGRAGVQKFALPADQIIPNSLEVIDGLVAMIAEARALNYF